MRPVSDNTWLLGLLTTAQTVLCLLSPSDIKPNNESVTANAYDIFNAIHSAGRQWGSAVKHNGFAFFPAIMPAGTVLYHGGCDSAVPKEFEWLAFEIEHASVFASSKVRGPGQPSPGDPDQKPLGEKQPKREKPFECPGGLPPNGNVRGYLHTYQLTRDARLLYIDGMSAAKSDFGTLDTQDFLLREGNTKGIMDEGGRAEDICQIFKEWGWDGFVRSELGFEVIYCDFTSGLHRVSLKRSFFHRDKMAKDELLELQWARAVAERYDDIGGGRLQIDYSSMVSGHFYPINISTWHPERPDLKRIGSAKMEDLLAIKRDLAEMAQKPRRFNVNWRNVIDMIITRYSEGLVAMGDPDSLDTVFVSELERAILIYVDAPPLESDVNSLLFEYDSHEDTEGAIEGCKEHWLLHAGVNKHQWSAEDKLIYTAVQTVVSDICNTLFDIRRELLRASSDSQSYKIDAENENFTQYGQEYFDKVMKQSRAALKDLMTRLDWTEWLKSRRCPVGELMMIAMFPYGDERDHFNPGCRSASEISYKHGSYWRPSLAPPRE